MNTIRLYTQSKTEGIYRIPSSRSVLWTELRLMVSVQGHDFRSYKVDE